MLVAVIGGHSHDAERLERLGTAAGFRFQIRPLLLPSAYRKPALDSAESAPTLRALVFEAEDHPEVAPLALGVIRRDEEFKDAFALWSLLPEQIGLFEPQSGFDDFLVRPYGAAELFGRIDALEWRRRGTASAEPAGLVIDAAGRDVKLDGRSVSLTSREYGLLSYLHERTGAVVTRRELLEQVWGSTYTGGPRTIDIHVRRLRKKLGDALRLETLRGSGYKLLGGVSVSATRAPLTPHPIPDETSAPASDALPSLLSRSLAP
jgi:DNA-binding winged helix-turn-helix (wHTH) protein